MKSTPLDLTSASVVCMRIKNYLRSLFGSTTPTVPLADLPQGYQMRASGTHGTIDLYGVVGGDWWSGSGITREQFSRDLQALGEVQTLTVNLASIGGDFDNGLPIFNILKQHPARVTVNVMGYALSMGSVLMLAGDEINIAQNGLVMIHSPITYAYGNAADLRKEAVILDKHQAAISALYAERMQIAREDVDKLLAAETWFTAEEALAVGLVDNIIDPVDLTKVEAGIPQAAWGMTMTFIKTPPQLVQKVRSTGVAPTIIQKDANEMTSEELTALGKTIAEGVVSGLATTLQQHQTPAPATEPPADPVLERLDAMNKNLQQQAKDLQSVSAKLAELEGTPVNPQKQQDVGSNADGEDDAIETAHYS